LKTYVIEVFFTLEFCKIKLKKNFQVNILQACLQNN